MLNVLNDPLPPCKLSTLRDYLTQCKYSKQEALSEPETEVWVCENNFGFVRIPLGEDPINYFFVEGVLMQMNKKLYDMPYYAKQIAQRFPEG